METAQPQPTDPTVSSPVAQSPTAVQKNGLKKIALIGGSLLILAVTGASGYYLGLKNAKPSVIVQNRVVYNSPTPQAVGVICTMEAKICPDGSSVGRTGPNCEFAQCQATSSSTTSSSSKFVLATDLTKTDQNGNSISNTKGNIYLPVPKTATAKDGTLVINKVIYSIQINTFDGLCPNDTYGSNCGYSDENVANSDTLRIWKNEKGVFGLNLMGVNIDGYYLSSVVVTKENKVPFSEAEITQWKELFQTLSSEPAK